MGISKLGSCTNDLRGEKQMGWNLPDGCTQDDIDRAYGDEEFVPKPADCRCEWEELDGSYFWDPDCPEHDEPEGACDEEWATWFASYRRGQECKAWKKGDRILRLFRGIHQIERIVQARSTDFLRHRIDGDEARECCAVLFGLRNQLEDEICAIAKEI
jgi:hypothetical protein